jgi:NAD(P)-dependent dehydrogenase (short-subunit alcohol dehydrogenase family)
VSGRVAIITGAASGIGAATARLLHRHGTRLVLIDRASDPVHDLAADLDAVAVAGDVTEPAINEHAVHVALDRYGRLDLLHANAGRTSSHGLAAIDFLTLPLQDYRSTMAVNLDAVVHGIRAAAPTLCARQTGAIIVTASLAGLTPYPKDPVYTMTKHALVGLVRALAEPLASDGVVISAVCPGLVDTPFIAAARNEPDTDDIPLIRAEDAGAAVWHAWNTAQPGALWVLQPGREPIAYRPPGVPGPRRHCHLQIGDGDGPTSLT